MTENKKKLCRYIVVCFPRVVYEVYGFLVLYFCVCQDLGFSCLNTYAKNCSVLKTQFKLYFYDFFKTGTKKLI